MTTNYGSAEKAIVLEDPAETGRSGMISKDDGFHLLQNSRRRAVMRYLLAHGDTEQFRMRDVAEEVAAWEHDTTVARLHSDERQRVYIALFQSHLPKLADHDVIAYNQDRGTIEPTPLLAAFGPFLEDTLDADCDHLALEDGHPEDHDDFATSVRKLLRP